MTEAAIRKLGFDARNLRLLLVGHAHSDHAGALAYLQKLSGAHMAVIEEEKDLLASGGKTDFHYGDYKEFYFDAPRIDQVFVDGDVLKQGDVAITALLTNGHTKGSTTFVTTVNDGGKAYVVVFPNGLSVNPGYHIVKGPSYVGIEANYRRTLRVLEQLKPDIWMFPHAETWDFEAKLARSKNEGVNAWVDPQGYRLWLWAQRDNLEATISQELGIVAKGRAD